MALNRGKFLNPFLEVGGKHKRSAAAFHRTQFTCLDRLIQGSFASARHGARLGDGIDQGIHGYVSQRRGGPANRAHTTANAGKLGHNLRACNRRHKKRALRFHAGWCVTAEISSRWGSLFGSEVEM